LLHLLPTLKNDKNQAKCGFLHSNRLVVDEKSGAQELLNADLRTAGVAFEQRQMP